MKVWTDKAGNKLTAGEFISRWKEGVKSVTPLQQVKSSILGYTIVFAGILWGLIMTFSIKQYWLFTILCGSLIISGIQFLGTLQKYVVLSQLENFTKEVKNVQESTKQDC